MASDEVRTQIQESMQLADKLGLNGTPSYVVGPNVVVGAVGYDALKDKIESARACAASASC
jgi:protein-disulfide isomerase